ncbi:MAG: PrsW family glutamic-type intramembrane protease [Candidatus Paceibacterota bacterium]
MALSFLLVLITALAPGIIWLLFFLKESIHPEPKKILAKVFGLGMIVGIPIALIQIFTEELLVFIGAPLIVLILLFSFTEEIFKFFAAWLGVGNSKYLAEPVDAMIYMIVAAIGLATMENFFILSNVVFESGLAFVSETSEVIILRFIGATFLHIIASGIIGYYWAKGRFFSRKHVIIWGLFLATIIHFIFNSLIIIFEEANYLIYPSLFLVFASMFLFRDFDELRKESIITKQNYE